MYNILLNVISLVLTSIYSHHYTDINGHQKSMAQHAGKKILLVNIATGSSRVNQLASLQQLHQQYGNNLAIIAFPSNSFGKEPRSNSQIKQFCHSQYGTSFALASKSAVSGSSINPVYNWLLNINENGMMNGNVVSDFQKFLIDKEGKLVGVFGPSVNPMDSSIINAINEN